MPRLEHLRGQREGLSLDPDVAELGQGEQQPARGRPGQAGGHGDLAQRHRRTAGVEARPARRAREPGPRRSRVRCRVRPWPLPLSSTPLRRRSTPGPPGWPPIGSRCRCTGCPAPRRPRAGPGASRPATRPRPSPTAGSPPSRRRRVRAFVQVDPDQPVLVLDHPAVDDHRVHVAPLGLERHVPVRVEQREGDRRVVVLDQDQVGLLARLQAAEVVPLERLRPAAGGPVDDVLGPQVRRA